MVNNFTRKIKTIDSEMLALKTAYTRGLGVANFYEIYESDEITLQYSNEYVYVTVEFVPQENGVPFAQCYVKDAQYFMQNDISWDSDTNKLTFKYMALIGQVTITFLARIVASAEINSVAISVGSI